MSSPAVTTASYSHKQTKSTHYPTQKTFNYKKNASQFGYNTHNY